MVDRDTEANEKKIEQIDEADNSSRARLTKLKRMENYFSPSLLGSEFGIEFTDEEKQIWENADVVDLVHQKIRVTLRRISRIKLIKK